MKQEDQNRERLLDEVLDRALARYVDVEPRAGLEDRLLANMRSQAQESRESWFGWKWGFVLAASLAIFVTVFLLQRSNQNAAPARSPQTAQVRGVAAVPLPSGDIRHNGNANTSNTSVSLASEPRPRQSRIWPAQAHAPAFGTHDQDSRLVARQSVFPSPAPPSEQELLLLRYVRQTPRNTVVGMSKPEDADQLFPPTNELQRPIE